MVEFMMKSKYITDSTVNISSNKNSIEKSPHRLSESDICVVVTSYNETLVEIVHCVNAILSNKIDVKDILLINDNPRRIKRSNRIRKIFPGIKLLNNSKTFGISYCRNFGLDYALEMNKPLVAFCDADDMWMNDKISTQLLFINQGYQVVSTGMYEINYCLKIKRIANVKELKCGGNPIFLSTVLLKCPSKTRFQNTLIEDREFFKDLFDNEFLFQSLKIVPKALIRKYNYKGRRGSHTDVVSLKKFLVLYFKIISIKKIEVSFLKFVIFHLFNIRICNRKIYKRIGLSVNFRSSEYRNLKNFSAKYNIPMFLKIWGYMNWERRNRQFCDAQTIKDIIVSIIYGKLENVKYAYVGLSGARLIREYVEIPSETIRIHVVHGRNTGEKFNTYTDAALSHIGSREGDVPAGKLWHYKPAHDFEYQDDVAVWFHGFTKGRRYDLGTFLSDFRFINQLRAKHNTVMVAPHPLATIMKIYLRWFTMSYLKFDVYTKLVLRCSTIYSSSPSISNSEIKRSAEIQGIEFVNLSNQKQEKSQ